VFVPLWWLALIAGIPFIGRMGGDDQDVPPWNLRRFVRTIQQAVNSTASAVVDEIPGEPHWWTPVVDDNYVQVT
jgi:hypothetical protein